MMRASALLMWILLGLCTGLGCIPIFTPLVEQDITTGDKLFALEHAKDRDDQAGDHPSSKPPPRYSIDALRAELLAAPPDMRASINLRDYRDALKTADVQSYSILNPGFYAPVSTERADLARAHAAGLLSDAEFAELNAELDRQAQRSVVRRWFELNKVAVNGSFHQGYFGGDSATTRTPDSMRRWALGSWLHSVLESGSPQFHDDHISFLRVYRGEARYHRSFLMLPSPPAAATPSPTPDDGHAPPS